MSDSDTEGLDRFVRAQEGVFDTACAELRQGRKRSHWMWFIFPQLRGLGRSATAWEYGLASLDEARAYLAHALLGPRLRTCFELALEVDGKSAHEIFGSPDDLKFRSSATLFHLAAPGDALFPAVLAKYCAGVPDPGTLALIDRENT